MKTPKPQNPGREGTTDLSTIEALINEHKTKNSIISKAACQNTRIALDFSDHARGPKWPTERTGTKEKTSDGDRMHAEPRSHSRIRIRDRTSLKNRTDYYTSSEEEFRIAGQRV